MLVITYIEYLLILEGVVYNMSVCTVNWSPFAYGLKHFAQLNEEFAPNYQLCDNLATVVTPDILRATLRTDKSTGGNQS